MDEIEADSPSPSSLLGSGCLFVYVHYIVMSDLFRYVNKGSH